MILNVCTYPDRLSVKNINSVSEILTFTFCKYVNKLLFCSSVVPHKASSQLKEYLLSLAGKNGERKWRPISYTEAK